MKTYYLEIVVGDRVHDVASVQADNYEGATKIVDAAAKNRGFTGFALREVDEAGFIAFKNKKAEDSSESLAGDSQGVPVPEGNDAAQENPEEPAAGQAAGGSEQDADKAA